MTKTDAERDYEGMRHFQAKFIAADQKLRRIRALVNEQAEDEMLWTVPAEGLQAIVEAYLQQELRRLHTLIESP